MAMLLYGVVNCFECDAGPFPVEEDGKSSRLTMHVALAHKGRNSSKKRGVDAADDEGDSVADETSDEEMKLDVDELVDHKGDARGTDRLGKVDSPPPDDEEMRFAHRHSASSGGSKSDNGRQDAESEIEYDGSDKDSTDSSESSIDTDESSFGECY
jgi:hypothetical protein